MNVIKNSNGNEYQVLEQNNKYLLLANLSPDGNRFVVAYNLHENGKTWQHGNYFDTLDEAQKYYQSKVI